MNYKIFINICIFILIITISGCYTLVIHPKVQNPENSDEFVQVRINDNCASCHDSYYFKSNNINYPIEIVNQGEQGGYYLEMNNYQGSYYDYNPVPWWFGSTSKDNAFKYRNESQNNNDKTKTTTSRENALRNNDGNRSSSTNDIISTPSPTKNDNTSSTGNNTKPNESNTKTDDRNKNTETKLRNNPGERGK